MANNSVLTHGQHLLLVAQSMLLVAPNVAPVLLRAWVWNRKSASLALICKLCQINACLCLLAFLPNVVIKIVGRQKKNDSVECLGYKIPIMPLTKLKINLSRDEETLVMTFLSTFHFRFYII